MRNPTTPPKDDLAWLDEAIAELDGASGTSEPPPDPRYVVDPAIGLTPAAQTLLDQNKLTVDNATGIYFRRLLREAGLVWPGILSQKAGLVLRQASTVRPTRTNWLWFHHIPFGQMTVIDGDPGIGKTTIALDIAARVTTGNAMPNSATGGTPATVVYMTAEDSVEQTLVPRLIALGANLTRVHFVEAARDEEGGLSIPEIPADLGLLDDALTQTGAVLVIIDPIYTFLGAQVDSHKDHEVKRALAPLTALLEKHQCACLLLRHPTKNRNTPAMYRGGGALGGIAGTVRAGFIVLEDPLDPARKVFAQFKNNLAPKQPSLAYRTEGYSVFLDDAVIETSRVVWDGVIEMTADELVAAQGKPGPDAYARSEAADFLRDILADGPVASKEVDQAAARTGISDRTLRRAKEELGVTAQKSKAKDGHWDLAMDKGIELGREVPNNIWTTPAARA